MKGCAGIIIGSWDAGIECCARNNDGDVAKEDCLFFTCIGLKICKLDDDLRVVCQCHAKGFQGVCVRLCTRQPLRRCGEPYCDLFEARWQAGTHV